jgi:hypothetical protein
MSPNAARPLFGGHINIGGTLTINVLLAFAFGVAFLVTMLVFATKYPNPSPFQIQVFITTLGLAAAGVGAMLPGTLNVQSKPLFRAGGALALFAVVFFFQPKIADSVVQIVPPSTSPEPVAATFLQAVDSGDTPRSWDELDPAARGVVVDSLNTLQRIYDGYRKPLGAVQSRVLIGTNSLQSPSGLPIGLYEGLSYRTKFADAPECRAEIVTLRATQDLKWRVFSYNISPNTIPCQ